MIRRESSMTSCCCKEYYEKPRNKIIVQFVLSVRGRKGWHTDTQPNPQSPKLSAEGMSDSARLREDHDSVP